MPDRAYDRVDGGDYPISCSGLFLDCEDKSPDLLRSERVYGCHIDVDQIISNFLVYKCFTVYPKLISRVVSESGSRYFYPGQMDD